MGRFFKILLGYYQLVEANVPCDKYPIGMNWTFGVLEGKLYWKPTTNCPDRDLECPDCYYDVCPECCGGDDNDDDDLTDCDDPDCACCCDQSEGSDDSSDCVPEPITLAMTALGILGVLGFVRRRREA